ncbi:hypothetical protein [Mycobacterium phage WXIN]|nr:hypothetical protein [Mycobacterium phage WXIN]
MRRDIDLTWWKFSLSAYRPRGWWTLHTPAGSIGIDHHRSVTKPGVSRGRRLEWDLRIPVTKSWQIHLATPGKDYLTLVGGPAYLRNLSWILDEFDSSFNDLAIASLRYHLDWSVCGTSEDRRKAYEDLITRLGEHSPGFTDEEMAILYPPGWTIEDDLDRRDGRILLKKSTPEEDAIYRAYEERGSAYRERKRQARHDFVDIMEGLWS